MPIKSFRAKIAQNGIDTISLHTNNGSTGYRVVKFQVLSTSPASHTQESIVKIFSVPQETATATIDFDDQTLLAAAMYDNSNSASYNPQPVVIFDNMVFNQDIYITHVDQGAAQPVNYYIELEQIKLDLNENTVATLKDIRNIEAQSV
jgi:hypothetical protein